MATIKACPFCGEDAEYFQSQPRTIGHGTSGDTVGVRCTGCKVQVTVDSYTDHEVEERQASALEKWNRRV